MWHRPDVPRSGRDVGGAAVPDPRRDAFGAPSPIRRISRIGPGRAGFQCRIREFDISLAVFSVEFDLGESAPARSWAT
jgi:hypothetical protein